MTRRRWMLTLGIVVFSVCAFALVQAVRPSPACSYDEPYPCAENPRGCTNPDGCLGDCKCDVAEGRCVPL